MLSVHATLPPIIYSWFDHPSNAESANYYSAPFTPFRILSCTLFNVSIRNDQRPALNRESHIPLQTAEEFRNGFLGGKLFLNRPFYNVVSHTNDLAEMRLFMYSELERNGQEGVVTYLNYYPAILG
jgi:hypothetical protein